MNMDEEKSKGQERIVGLPLPGYLFGEQDPVESFDITCSLVYLDRVFDTKVSRGPYKVMSPVEKAEEMYRAMQRVRYIISQGDEVLREDLYDELDEVYRDWVFELGLSEEEMEDAKKREAEIDGEFANCYREKCKPHDETNEPCGEDMMVKYMMPEYFSYAA